MTRTPFVTGNMDLALTKLASGRTVHYSGVHQGVFRFESVKLLALRSCERRTAPDDLLAELAAAPILADANATVL